MASRQVHLFTYSPLPGVAGGRLEGPMTSSPRGMLDAVCKYRVSSAASDHGSITAWKDDQGHYRAEFNRHFVALGSGVFTTKVKLIEWLRSWWPAMGDPHFSPEEPAHG